MRSTPRPMVRVSWAIVLCLAAGDALQAGPPAPDCIFASGFDEDGSHCRQRWIGGYYVGYERGLQSPDQIDFTAVTHLMVGRVRPLADATLATDFDIDPAQGPIWAQAAVAAAHGAGRRAILMVGGAGEVEGWRAAASPGNRPTFVGNLLAVMDQFDADGLDLDWEPIHSQDHADVIALAQALRDARPDMLLTVPVDWINTNLQWNPRPVGEPAFLAAIVPIFDQINVMSYEMAAPYDGWHSWFASPLHGHAVNTPSSAASSVQYYLDHGVPVHRLGIGIGFYGNCMRGVSVPRQPVTPTNWGGSDGAMSYRNIVSHYLPAMTAHFDAEAGAPWLGNEVPGGIGPMQCNFVSYEDSKSIAEKGRFARDMGLGGAIIWTISQGHLPGAPGSDPLLDAVGEAFLP